MFCKVVFDVPLDRDFDYKIPDELVGKVQAGVRVTAPFGRQLTCGLVTSVSEISTAPQQVQLKDIVRLVDQRPLFGTDFFPLARFIKSRYGGPIGQILFALVPPQPFYKADFSAESFAAEIKNPPLVLTDEQARALKTIQHNPPYQFGAFLLHGPARCGKTEIILRRAGEVLAAYGQVLLTVPDLVAARQFVDEAEVRFGAQNVFCWHSRMLQSKKKKYFSAISGGRPCVVISTRSGVLLPFKNLRFAAMLGEGDENYKQEENKPYYHAREVLSFRAAMHGSTLVFSSAAPSAEMLYQVETKQVKSLLLTTPVPERHFEPQVKITPKKGEKSRLFSDVLLAELADNLACKKTALLILNRRGYANAYACLNCGAYAVCKKCGGILTREKSAAGEEFLVCKKCAARESVAQECPKCHNLVFKALGGGTQKIVTELTKLFPQAKILRLDSDAFKTKQDQGFEALRALTNGSADFIVGTRMASGALRGSRVTLAAVLDSELELDGPDFRAGEKFTQLLFELRGHLSGVANGRLIIQTADPEKYNYEPILKNDFSQAAREEQLARQAFLYPPYARLIRVTLKTKEENLLKAQTQLLAKWGAQKGIEVLGPVWCAKKTDVLKKQYLLFKTDENHFLDVLACLDSWPVPKKLTFQLTADPYNFY